METNNNNNIDANETVKGLLIQIRNSLIEQQEIWSINDFSKFTGFSIYYIETLCQKKLINHYKSYGRHRTFFLRSDIMSWLMANEYKMIRGSLFKLDQEVEKFNKARSTSQTKHF